MALFISVMKPHNPLRLGDSVEPHLHKWEFGWLKWEVKSLLPVLSCFFVFFTASNCRYQCTYKYLKCTQHVNLMIGLINMHDYKSWEQCGENLKEHLEKLSSVNVLHSTPNHMVGQRVIKIWVKFKLPQQLTPESPSSCNTGLDYHHTSKLGSTTQG